VAIFLLKVVEKVAVEENSTLEVPGQGFVVGLQKQYHILQFLMPATMLEKLVNEEIENVVGGIVALKFLYLGLGKRNQIVDRVLVSFEPDRFRQILQGLSIIDGRHPVQMQILAPLLRQNWRVQAHVQRLVLPLWQF
jgi:hypothetical protein